MTYKEQYRSYRWQLRFNITVFLLPIISDIYASIHFGRFANFSPWWFPVAYCSYFLSSIIFFYFRMKKAKRYIVMDEFLKKQEHEKVPEGFISKEEVETKSIAMWWKVNEKEHQN